MNPLKEKNWDLCHFGCPPSSEAMFPVSFSPLQCYTADLCRDRRFCITKFYVQILPLSQGIHELFCVHLASVTMLWAKRSLMSVQVSQQLRTAPHHRHTDMQWNSAPKSDRKFQLQCDSRNHFFVVYIYLVLFQSIHMNQVIVVF